MNHCLIPELNHPSNLAFRRHHRIVLLQRLLPVLADMLSAEQLVDVSSELPCQQHALLGKIVCSFCGAHAVFILEPL